MGQNAIELPLGIGDRNDRAHKSSTWPHELVSRSMAIKVQVVHSH